MNKYVPIPDDVADVLRRATGTDNLVRLPDGQLDRSLYAKIDKVLVALGGKWDRRAGGHVFSDGLGDQLFEALVAGEVVDQKKSLEQFFTPPEIAARMYDAVQLGDDDHVLEPSAGMGALLAEPLRRDLLISAVELDERLAGGLRDIFGRMHGVGIWNADFMQWSPVARAPITVALMNPPFSRGQDMKHVRRAYDFLAPGGRLAAIMSPHWTFAEDSVSTAFQFWIETLDAEWEPLPDNSFRASGTNVSTGLLLARKAPRS